MEVECEPIDLSGWVAWYGSVQYGHIDDPIAYIATDRATAKGPLEREGPAMVVPIDERLCRAALYSDNSSSANKGVITLIAYGCYRLCFNFNY